MNFMKHSHPDIFVVELNRFVSIKSYGCCCIGSVGPAELIFQVAWIFQVVRERLVVSKLQVLQVAARFQVTADVRAC